MSYEGSGSAGEALVFDGSVQKWSPIVNSISGTFGIVCTPTQGDASCSGEALLPRDGSRAMTGDLDMGEQDVGNVKNVNYSGIFVATNEVDFTNGQKQELTLTLDAALTFTGGVAGGNYILHIKQDTTGDWEPTWPANVKSADSSIRISVTAETETIVALYFDGTFYHMSSSPNSSDEVTTDPV